MRLASFLLAALTVASVGTAQMAGFPGTGCRDNGLPPQPITANGPVVAGNLTLSLSTPCDGTANAAFVIWGTCNAALPSWNLSDPCFGGWAAPPASCPNTLLQLFLFDGALVPGGTFNFAFPMPDLRPAVDLAQISQSAPGWCWQVICVELGNPNPCQNVSQGTAMVVTNPP